MAVLFKKALLICCVFIFLLFSGIWGLGGYLIAYQLNKAIEPFNVQLSATSRFTLNPFKGVIGFDNIAIHQRMSNDLLFSVQSAKIDVNLLALFLKQLSFDELAVNGVFLSITRNKGGISIAGIDHSLLAPEQVETSSSQQLINDKPMWRMDFSNVDVSNIHIDLLDFGFDHNIILNTVDVDAITATSTAQYFNLTTNGSINNAKLMAKLAGEFIDASGDIMAELELSDFTFEKVKHYFPKTIQQLSASTDASFKLSAQVQPHEFLFTVSDLEFIAENIELDYQDLNTSIGRVEIESKQTLATIALPRAQKNQGIASEHVEIESDVTLNIHMLAVEDKNQRQQLLSLTQFNSLPINLSYQDDVIRGSSEGVSFEHLRFAQDIEVLGASVNTTNGSYTLADVEQVELKGIEYVKDTLTLSEISIDAIKTDIILDQERQLANMPQIFNQEAKHKDKAISENEQSSHTSSIGEHPESVEQPSQAAPTFNFTIHRIALTAPAVIYFRDMSFEQHVERTIRLEHLALDNLTSNKDESTSYALIAEVDQHAKLTFKGAIQPWSEKLNVSLNANLAELSLPTLSAYLGDAASLSFASGQLDSEIELNIKDDILLGESGILLRGVEIQDLENNETEGAGKGSIISLGSAFNMLKDDHDNVSLDIPLSGNIADPEFGFSSFINIVTKKALMAATETYLIQTFVPYANIVSIAKFAGGYMLKTDIKPMNYQKSQITLSMEQREYIDQIAGLMQERSEMHIKLCAISVSNEISDVVENPTEKLNELSRQRAEQLKQYLMEEKSIASKRVLLCAPRVDNNVGALPRMEFSL